MPEQCAGQVFKQSSPHDLVGQLAHTELGQVLQDEVFEHCDPQQKQFPHAHAPVFLSHLKFKHPEVQVLVQFFPQNPLLHCGHEPVFLLQLQFGVQVKLQ